MSYLLPDDLEGYLAPKARYISAGFTWCGQPVPVGHAVTVHAIGAGGHAVSPGSVTVHVYGGGGGGPARPLGDLLLEIDPTATVDAVDYGVCRIEHAPGLGPALEEFRAARCPVGMTWHLVERKPPAPAECEVCLLATASVGRRCRYCAGCA